jgi:ribosome-binding protein aMBF1 (putative translation factor)
MAARNGEQRLAYTATEADWSFTENSEQMSACEIAAARAAREFDAIEYEDALQETYLYLAVRPELQARGLSRNNLAQQLYAHALREPAIRDSDRRSAEQSYDVMAEEEVL